MLVGDSRLCGRLLRACVVNICSREVKGKAMLLFSEMASSTPAYVEMGERDLPTGLQLLDGSVPSHSPLLIAFAAR